MDKIYRRGTQSNGTEKKKKDEKKRKRNVILNFRVSPEEKILIEERIALSGMPKAEFFIQSCLHQTIQIQGNVRTLEAIRQRLNLIEQQIAISGEVTEWPKELVEALITLQEIVEKH